MKKPILIAGLICLALAPSLCLAQEDAPTPSGGDQEEDQYDKDYEACSQVAEDKADPLPEEKREDVFVKYFHECMKQKGHDISSEEDDLPPPDDNQDMGAGVEE
jgi:hypothetical protein